MQSLTDRIIEAARKQGLYPRELRKKKLLEYYYLRVRAGSSCNMWLGGCRKSWGGSVNFEAVRDACVNSIRAETKLLWRANGKAPSRIDYITSEQSSYRYSTAESTESSEEPKLCTCLTFDLVNFGCQCGGV